MADRIVALFAALQLEHVDAMPLAERRRFADLCRHWAALAEPAPDAAPRLALIDEPWAGILADLRRGVRAE